MLPVLKGMRFNYPEQSLRQNNLPDYPFTQLHFKSPVSEPSGSSGQYVPPAWQCRVGVPTTEGFTSLQGPCLRRCRTWPAEDPVETRTCSSKSTGSKSLCFWYWGFIFPFDAVMGDVQEEIPSSSTDSRFTEQCDNVCLVFQTAEEKKKMFSMDLWKQKHRFVLFEVCHSFSDNSMFSGALGGPSFLQIRLAPGESGKFVSRTFSSTLCLPPTLCSLCNAHLQWSQCPMGLTTDYSREGSNLGLIDSN